MSAATAPGGCCQLSVELQLQPAVEVDPVPVLGRDLGGRWSVGCRSGVGQYCHVVRWCSPSAQKTP